MIQKPESARFRPRFHPRLWDSRTGAAVQDVLRGLRSPAARVALSAIAVVASTAALQALSPPEVRGQDVTAIVGATIIDGNGGAPTPDGVIVITGDRISAVGPRGSVTVPASARVIDGTGKYVTPGFIDTNVHVSLYGAGETIVRYEPRNADLTLEAAQLHLKHGITTIRDSYGSLLPLMQIRDAIARGDTVGPRMLVAGNIVGWGGPYSISFSLQREQGLTLFQEQFNDFITQGSGEELMDMEIPELRQAINDYLDLGPDLLKYGGTGHFSDPVMIGFSQRAQDAIVEEVHKRGLVAETHSTNSEGLRMSILAGIDLIQHPEVLPGDMSDELVGMIVDRGIVCAMLTNTITGDVWQEHIEERQKAAEAESKADSAKADSAGAGGQERARSKTSAELRAERRSAGLGIEIRRRNAQKLIERGCIVTIGTDNYLGSAPEFRRTPKRDNQEAGIGSIIAIEGLVELGMTPAQAIVAATRNGAIACKALDDLGTIDVGKLADINVFDADPLADIHNIRTLSAVLKEGRVVDLESLPYQRIFSTPRADAETEGRQ